MVSRKSLSSRQSLIIRNSDELKLYKSTSLLGKGYRRYAAIIFALDSTYLIELGFGIESWTVRDIENVC